MSTRLYLTIMISLMVNTATFGIGSVTILSVPLLSESASYLIPILTFVSFVVTPFIAWMIAPRLQMHYGL
jgi:hypothetical protein